MLPVTPHQAWAGSGGSALPTGRGRGSSRTPGTPSHPMGQEVGWVPGRPGREGSRWWTAGKEEVAEAERSGTGDGSPGWGALGPRAVIMPHSFLGSETRGRYRWTDRAPGLVALSPIRTQKNTESPFQMGHMGWQEGRAEGADPLLWPQEWDQPQETEGTTNGRAHTESFQERCQLARAKERPHFGPP